MATLEFVIRAVDDASRQLESVARTLQRVTGEAEKQSRVWQQQLGVIREFGVAMTAAGAAVTGALGGMIAATVRYGEAIDRASKMTGVAAEELQRLAFAAQQEHASLETLTRGLVYLQRAMVDAAAGNREAEAAFRALGISVQDATGQLRPVEDVLLEIADRFASTSDSASKAELALRLFGRSGAELVPFLNQGSSAIRELGEGAQRMGLVLGQEAVAAAERFGDSMGALRAALQGVANAVGSALLPALTTLVQYAAAVVAAVARWASENQGLLRTVGPIVAALGALMAALGPVLMVLPALVNGFRLLQAGLGALITVLRSAAAAVVAFLSAWGPWIALGAAVGAAVAVIIRNLDNLGRALHGAGEMLRGFGQILLGAFTLDMGRIQRGWDQIKAGFSELRDALASTAQRIATDVGGMWERVRSALRLPELPALADQVRVTEGRISAPALRIGELIRGIGHRAKETAQDVDVATQQIDHVLVARGRAWEGFASEAVRALGWLGQSTRETMAAAAGVVEAEASRIQAALQAGIQQLLNTIIPALQRAGQAWQGLASEASRAAGWMGQSTRESAAAAQQALQQWDQYIQQRIQQMRHEVEVGRLTRDELIAQLQQLLQQASLNAQQRMQIEQLLTSEQQRLVQERLQAMQHELNMGRMTTQEYVAMLQQLLTQHQLTAQQRMQIEQQLVQTVVQAVLQRLQAMQQEAGQMQVSAEQMRTVLTQLAEQYNLTAEQIAAIWHQLQQRLATTNQQIIQDTAKMGQEFTQKILPGIQSAFENFFTAVATGSKSLGQAFGDLASQIGTVLLQAIVKMLAEIVAKWLAAAIAAIWASLATTYGILAPLMAGIALAVIAWITGLVKFAKGGIVKEPTLGLLGEAGPEVVIPLERLPRILQLREEDKEIVERLDRLITLVAAMEVEGHGSAVHGPVLTGVQLDRRLAFELGVGLSAHGVTW